MVKFDNVEIDRVFAVLRSYVIYKIPEYLGKEYVDSDDFRWDNLTDGLPSKISQDEFMQISEKLFGMGFLSKMVESDGKVFYASNFVTKSHVYNLLGTFSKGIGR